MKVSLYCHTYILTHKFPKLVKGLKASGIIYIIGLKCDTEKVTIGIDGFSFSFFLCATKSVHFPIFQFDIEVGKFNIITLGILNTSVNKGKNVKLERCLMICVENVECVKAQIYLRRRYSFHIKVREVNVNPFLWLSTKQVMALSVSRIQARKIGRCERAIRWLCGPYDEATHWKIRNATFKTYFLI